MTQFHWTLVCIAWFLLFSAAEAQEIGAPDPLFQSDEILDVRIVAPTGHRLEVLPQGSSYLGFIFAEADAPAEVERALRSAHAALDIRIDPFWALV